MTTHRVSARGADSARLAVSAISLEPTDTIGTELSLPHEQLSTMKENSMVLDSIRLNGHIAFLYTGGVSRSLRDHCTTWAGRTP